MALIKGITVTLYERTQTGKDTLNAPVYVEQAVPVENVLISPVSAEEVLSDIQLTGKHAVYELSLPKGDAHKWDDSKVEFFGRIWHTCGPAREWMPGLVPGTWNKKVKVERYE